MGRSITAALAVAVAIALAAPAHADPDDDEAFLNTLHQQGIYVSEPLTQGHAVCMDIQEHPADTFSDIAVGVAGYNPTISENDAAFMAGAAIAAYCPRYKYLMHEGT
jgi:hypothetical protein